MNDAQLVRAVLDMGGLTQSRLAEILAFKSSKTISRWLRGESRLRSDTAEQLRAMYLAMDNGYGDDDDVRYIHLYAGAFLQPQFDPIKAFRDAYIAFSQLSRRKRIRIEWGYGNSRFHRRELTAAQKAFTAAINLCTEHEAEWRFALQQNLLGTHLELVKQAPSASEERRQLLADALLICEQVIAHTADSIAYVNALEVASQLEDSERCDRYFLALLEVSGGAYADPYYRPTRNSLALGEAEEFRFLRTCRAYRRKCGLDSRAFLTAPRRPVL